jgi:hypothetical protein
MNMDYFVMSGISESMNYGEWNTTSDMMLMLFLVFGALYFIARLALFGALIYYSVKYFASKLNNIVLGRRNIS